MASYKLIQDVEADDKLLGPLSFKQFVYAFVAVIVLYLSYFLYAHHGQLLDIFTIPIALFSGFLAYPFGKDQPTEIWAIAKLRFFLKPRKRIWAQSGLKELVTITVPKKIEVQRTNGLSEVEVQSRLQALANTIDSRGWAIKNIYQNPLTTSDDSDRLISASTMPKDVPEYDLPDSEDMLNEAANPTARQVYELLNASTAEHRQRIIQNLNDIRTEKNDMPLVAPSVIGTPQPAAAPASEVDVEKIESNLKNAYATSHAPLNNMHTLRSRVNQPAVQEKPVKQASTSAPNPVIMNLARRNDLNVNVLSDEVSISLR